MVKVARYKKLAGSQSKILKGLRIKTEPIKTENWDDNWTGYEYKDRESFLADASSMDELNLPIKMVFMSAEATEDKSMLEFYRLLPRHGRLSLLILRDAKREDFEALLEAVEKFYGKKAGFTRDYDGHEFYWSLGEEFGKRFK